MQSVRHYILLLVTLISFILMPCAANAAYQMLQCDGNGGVTYGTQLFDSDTGNAGAGQEGSGACKYQGIQHIFSQVICDFTTILNSVMGKVYCGIQFQILNALRAVLTIYVLVFGAQLLMGTAELTARDIIIRLLKIATVWAFATKSAFGINFMFNFFMSFIGDATGWVINALDSVTIDWGDGTTTNIGDPTTDPTNPQGIGPISNGDIIPVFGFLDAIIFKVFMGPNGPTSQAAVKVVGFFMGMMVVYPPMYLMATNWVWTTTMTLVRTVISFLMCLAAIAFLISLCPIFFSLMLFQSTSHFFENWLRYMVSYALQIVFVLAIIVLWLVMVIQFMHFFNDLSKLIFAYLPDKPKLSGPLFSGTDAWAICPPNYGEDSAGAPTAKCPKDFNADPKLDPLGNPTAGDAWRADSKLLIPPTKIITDSKFLKYVFYHLATLLIITHAFGVLLENAPQIAVNLSGANAPPLIPSGFGTRGFGGAIGKSTASIFKASGGPSRQIVKNFQDLLSKRADPPGG